MAYECGSSRRWRPRSTSPSLRVLAHSPTFREYELSEKLSWAVGKAFEHGERKIREVAEETGLDS